MKAKSTIIQRERELIQDDSCIVEITNSSHEH